MTEPPPAPSALDDYRATFGNRYDLRRLWQDRRLILSQPRLATEVSAPLSLSPLRFALTLSVVPLLTLGWIASQLSGLMYPEGPAPTPTESIARAIEHPLDRYLDGEDAAQVRAWGKTRLASLSAAAVALHDSGKQRLSAKPQETDVVRAAAASEAFVSELEQAPISIEERKVIASRLLKRARSTRYLESLGIGLTRSFFEGGAAAQAITAFSLLVSAWMFRRMVRRDPRFPRGERADRLMLYYVTSRLFWLTLASLVGYVGIAFASASANAALLAQASLLQQIVALLSLLYLLMCSATIARALRDDDDLPPGAMLAIAWRLLASQLLSALLVMALAAIIGIVFGIAAGLWYALR